MQRQLIPYREIHISLLDGVDASRNLLFTMEQVENVEEMPLDQSGRKRLRVTLRGSDEDVSALLASLVKAEVPVVHFSEETRDLEEVFMRATKGIVS
jgi:ABC-2 type transport system ATP-binding protein